MKQTARNAAVAAALALQVALPATAGDKAPSLLAGTWTLVAADKELADGTRTHDYGASPTGRLEVDAAGRYSLQIFKQERVPFASGDKATATDAEFKDALLGTSGHFGTIDVDAAAGVLLFTIEDSSFPNWRGTQQKRWYVLDGDVLTYRVPPRPDGSVPVTVWRRLR